MKIIKKKYWLVLLTTKEIKLGTIYPLYFTIKSMFNHAMFRNGIWITGISKQDCLS